LDTAGAKQQFKIGRAWCAQNGYKYHILTDTEMRSGHRLKNIKLLWKYSRVQVPTAIRWSIHDYLLANPYSTTVDDLCGYLSDKHDERPDYFRQYIYCLLFHHHLEVDISSPSFLSEEILLPEHNVVTGDA
jgi:hypothetical protein